MDRYQRIEAKERQRERDTQLTRPEPEQWVDEGLVPPEAGSGRRSRSRQDRQRGTAADFASGKGAGGKGSPDRRNASKRRREGAQKVIVDAPGLVAMVGKQRAQRLSGRLNEAALAFLEDRYLEARSILKPIVDEVPALPQARELYGLTLYRLGRWKPAVDQLEELRVLTNHSAEQNHVLADCYRALGRHDRVEELWLELREASPGADVVSEGRIVAAGSKADQGNYPAAIAILSKGFRLPRNPEEFHLRRAYALADLYERSGDLVQARTIFERLESSEPDYLDVEERISALG
jgi:tetratricopeptide (TPR) repeat protein